ncbi:MAG: ABC transporter permease [Actinomycetota bacterium]|nr:ABC transporter permease [Actinomycetota bacterium]
MTALGWWFSDAWVMTMRNLRRIPRTPDLLFFLTLQPILFILLFAYVFGGAIRVPGMDYKQFLMPGIFVQTVAFGSVAATGIGMAEDLQKGIIDRFRSLPMTRSSVLVGRSMSDAVRSAFSLAVMLAVGFAIGFRFQGGVAPALAGVALLLFFGFSFSWLAALVGMSVKTVEAAQSGGFIWLFPLTFASSAFVPTASMPGWLRAFAEHQPVTVTVNALRALFNGTAVGGSAWQSAVWSLAVLAVCVPLAVTKYRRVSR